MNNLKFRAYIKSINKVVDVLKIDFKSNTLLLDIDSDEIIPKSYYWWYETTLSFEDVEIMQSTGLFDKNGVEIFEGDIVRNTHTGSVGRVHWCVHNTGFFYYVEKDKKDYTVFRANHNLEVIGNVYENKELIQNEI